MSNENTISSVAKHYNTIPQTQSASTIDWKAFLSQLILQFFHSIKMNSTFTYNGKDQTIEYEYHGREKLFKISASPTIKNTDLR